MAWHLGFVKSQNKTQIDENLNDDDDEEHGDTVASFHTLKFQPIQAKSAQCNEDERLQYKSSTTMKIVSARFYESSMDCMLVSGKLFSNTSALDSVSSSGRFTAPSFCLDSYSFLKFSMSCCEI